MNNALIVRNVSKTFDKFKLDNISFEVPGGSIVGVIGKNGCGKSGGEDFTKSLDNISKAFDGRVLVMPDVAEGNRIILAKKGPKETYSVELLDQRAAELQASRHLPAKKIWKKLKQENNLKGEFEF